MAFDLGVCSVSEPDISTLSGYAYDYALQETTEIGGILASATSLHASWSGPLRTMAM